MSGPVPDPLLHYIQDHHAQLSPFWSPATHQGTVPYFQGAPDAWPLTSRTHSLWASFLLDRDNGGHSLNTYGFLPFCPLIADAISLFVASEFPPFISLLQLPGIMFSISSLLLPVSQKKKKKKITLNAFHSKTIKSPMGLSYHSYPLRC